MDLADGVVDINEGDAVGIRTGEHLWHLARESGQEAGADLVELLHVPVGEGAQERAQRRRRADTREEPAHPAMSQQVEVIDGVGTGEHPANHRRSLRARVGRGHRQALEQVVEANGLGQPQRRDQTGCRHQVRVIEDRPNRVRRFHLRGAPLEWFGSDVAIQILPAQEGILVLRHAHTAERRRWIRVELAEERVVDSDWSQLQPSENEPGQPPPMDLLRGAVTSPIDVARAIDDVDLRWRLDAIMALDDYVE